MSSPHVMESAAPSTSERPHERSASPGRLWKWRRAPAISMGELNGWLAAGVDQFREQRAGHTLQGQSPVPCCVATHTCARCRAVKPGASRSSTNQRTTAAPICRFCGCGSDPASAAAGERQRRTPCAKAIAAITAAQRWTFVGDQDGRTDLSQPFRVEPRHCTTEALANPYRAEVERLHCTSETAAATRQSSSYSSSTVPPKRPRMRSFSRSDRRRLSSIVNPTSPASDVLCLWLQGSLLDSYSRS